MMKISKPIKPKELVAMVAERATINLGAKRIPLNLTKAVLDAFFAVCEDEFLNSDNAVIPFGRLGKLIGHIKPSSYGRNPKTKERIWIPPTKQVKFRMTPSFKKALNPGRETIPRPSPK